MTRYYGWLLVCLIFNGIFALSGCHFFKMESSSDQTSPTRYDTTSASLPGNSSSAGANTPTSSPGALATMVATLLPTQIPTAEPTPTFTNNNGNLEGLGDASWIDPHHGQIISAPGYSNPAYSIKKDLRLRIIYLKTSDGQVLAQNPQLEAQAVMNTLNETYTHQGKKGFNFVLDEVKTVVDDANFNLVNLSQINSLGDTYSNSHVYTLLFVKKMGSSGNINGTSGLFTGLSDKQLVIFAHSNIALKDTQGNFTGYKVTIDHEVGHMFGMIHTSDPSGGSRGSGNGTPGFSNENTILQSYVGSNVLCPKNFNFHVIQNNALTEKVHGVDYEGYKHYLFPAHHYQRVDKIGKQGRTYERTNMMDCYYLVKLIQNRSNK